MVNAETSSLANQVIEIIKTNCKTIEQLTPVGTVPGDACFELSGGRRVSYADLANQITSALANSVASFQATANSISNGLGAETNTRIANDNALSGRLGTVEGSVATHTVQLASLNSALDQLMNGNTTAAIESFNEVLDFLENVHDDKKLTQMLLELRQLISTEETNRKAADNAEVTNRNSAIQTAINTEIADRNTAISAAIADEATNRDTAISYAIGTEVANRNGAIQTAFNNEVSARDAAISAAIADEVTNRDTAISEAIADEQTARNELTQKVNNIGVRTAPTDMADLILATEDGSPIATFDGGHVSTRNFDSRTAATRQDIEQAVAAVRHPVTAVPSSVADLVLATPDGTPIVTFDGGHIRTRYFDSANIAAGGGSGHPVQVQHTDEAQLIVLDDEGQEALRVQDGHIITENFNSAYSGSGGESGSEYAGKWLSVIGDSISSKYLDGVTPMINRFFYDATTGTGVNSIDQMWWKIVGDTMGMQLRKVAAIGGTTVTGNSQQTEYSDSCGCSTARVEAIKNEDGFAPDVVIVYMGFNDWNAGRTVGTLTSAAPAEGTVNTFAQAYLLMVLKVLRAYPKAKVCCCTVMDCHRGADTSWPVKNSQGATVADFNNIIRQVCEMTGAVCIDVHSCGVNYHSMGEYSPSTDGIHPNAKGQRKMAEKIIKTLKTE